MKKKTLQFFAAFLSLVMLSTSSSLSTLALALAGSRCGSRADDRAVATDHAH